MFLLAPSPLKAGMFCVPLQTCLSNYWLFPGFHLALWFRYIFSVLMQKCIPPALIYPWQTQVANLY